jgi:CRP-like cAMP-binding protein
MRISLDPRANQLIAALPEPDVQRLLPLLEPVEMPWGEVLFDAGVKTGHVYFPSTALVSLLHTQGNGATAEIALVGNEGVVGLSLLMGDAGTPSRAVVQSAGVGFRMAAQALLDEFNRAGAAIHVLLRYTQALLAQMAHTAACNRLHPLEQQLCRRLLLSMDRLPAHRQLLTQTLAAELLGVSQKSLDRAALHLHNAGLIRTEMGCIQVMDRPRLEQRACGCYQAVKAEYAGALLPRVVV